MAGPWEKYGGGAPAASGGAAPWEKYGGSTPAADAAPTTIQEMHPDFTVADRFVVKNFGGSPEDQVGYLQKRHPNLEITADKGNIKARSKGSNEPYKVLDPDLNMPSTGSTLGDIGQGAKEGLMDLGDVGWDALSGVGTTAATAAGGLAGGLLGGGVGALPVAMAAGGAAGAGLEGMRQGIGGLLGVNSGNLANVGWSAAGGTAGPLLFGTGATGAQVAAKAAENGLAPDVAQSLLSSQSGLLGRARDAVAGAIPAIGEKLSGVPADRIKGLMENYSNLGARPLRQIAEDTASSVKDAVAGAKSAAWDTYQNIVSQSKTPVDVTPVRQAFQDAIKKAEANSSGTEASQELVDKLKAAYDKHFMVDKVVSSAAPQEVATGLLDASGNPLTKTVEGVAEKTVRVPVDNLLPNQAAQLDKELSEVAGFSGLGAGAQGGNRYGQAATYADKAIGQTAASAKKALDESMADVLLPDALNAKANYARVANLGKQAEPLFKGTDKTLATMRNMSSDANEGKKELLDQLDKEFGTKIGETSRLVGARASFLKPSPLPVSSKGTTSTSRSGLLGAGGALLGAKIDQDYNHGSGVGGGIAGGALGGLLGGPAALKAYIGLGRQLQTQGPAAPAAAQSVWNMLHNQ